ncbi:MAG: glycosyltransferase family 4 protein [Thermaerobacter sp.]|nr:glycosyltransferase family 4 protein [Thermaerobacter sp.]
MKILLATYFGLPHVGGINTYVEFLRAELERRGHAVDVLHRGYMESDPTDWHWLRSDGRITDDHWSRHYVEDHLPACDPWIRQHALRRYGFEIAARHLGIADYDVIHTQDSVAARAIARVLPTGVGLVATLHGSMAADLAAWGLLSTASQAYRYITAEERAGIAAAHRVLVPSRWAAGRMAFLTGAKERSMEVLYYGIDREKFLRQARQAADLPDAPEGLPLLLCPARLDPVKGHRYLLEAVALLQAAGRKVHLWIAGPGPAAKLEEQAQRLGIAASVSLLGSRDDVPQLMRRADAIVLPSIEDSLPYAVIEAQVAGKPIVASRAGGIPEMIEHGATGLLARPGDSKDLAAQVGLLFADSRLRAQIGERAAAFAVDAWDKDRHLSRLEAAYGAAQQAAGPRPLRDLHAAVFDPGAWPASLPQDYVVPDAQYLVFCGFGARGPSVIPWTRQQTTQHPAQPNQVFVSIPGAWSPKAGGGSGRNHQ